MGNLTDVVFCSQAHPELEGNDFYVTGESYAGHYVPHIATYILEHGAEPLYAPLRRQFVGVGLGDEVAGPAAEPAAEDEGREDRDREEDQPGVHHRVLRELHGLGGLQR